MKNLLQNKSFVTALAAVAVGAVVWSLMGDRYGSPFADTGAAARAPQVMSSAPSPDAARAQAVANLSVRDAVTKWMSFYPTNHKGVRDPFRSEEHTSELQSQFRISYAVFCL